MTPSNPSPGLPAFPCAALPYLPHDAPMALVETVQAYDPQRIRAAATVRPDSVFAGADGLPAWVGVEYMAQAVAAHAGLSAAAAGEPVRRGFLLGTRKFDWSRPRLAIGSVLTMTAECRVTAATGLASFDCELFADGIAVGACRINVYQPDDADAFLETQ